MDAGTGGLDLAYEVMRGYDALVILDVSRQGGEPGTLYVMEPDEESVEPASRTARRSTRTGWIPQTVLRFVKSVGAWPGRVVVVACEPAEVEEIGLRAVAEQVQARSSGAVELVRRDGRRAARRGAREGGGARAVAEQRDRQHRRQARRRAAGDASVNLRVGRLRQVVPRHARVLLRVRRPRDGLRGRPAGAGGRSTPGCAAAPCEPRVGDRDPRVPLPDLRRQRRRRGQRQRVRSRVDRGRGGPHASHKGEGRRGGARRQQHDRHGQPGRLRPRRRHGRQLHERARAPARRRCWSASCRASRACAWACSRATCRASMDADRLAEPARAGDAAQHRSGLRRRVPPGRQHGALGARRAAAGRRSTCW